jgi:hypothetical protein
MPYRISTPEDWFRINQRDLHLIELTDTNRSYSKSEYKKAREILNKWFAEHLPTVALGAVGPSEYSGWIEGGPCYITADFDPADIAVFNAAWGPNTTWTLNIWPFEDWLTRVSSTKLLTTSNLSAVKIYNGSNFYQTIRWCDTPKGIWLLDGYSSGTFVGMERGEHSLSLGDSWWRLVQLFPEFSTFEADAFPSGYYRIFSRIDWDPLLMIEFVFDAPWESDKYKEDPQKIQSLRKALGIPDELAINIAVGDF